MAIQIIGNVGNAGFALPMVQAYPTDVNAQSLLAWNPTAQALDYVTYTGNALGDFGVTRDLAVGRDLTVGRNASITGVLTTLLAAPAVLPAIVGNLTLSGTGLLTAVGYNVGANPVVGSRKLGWAAATGTATRTTFATSTVTLPLLAERVKALIDDLIAHGLIGP